jgi:cytochrome c-type biogenesis protein CcmH
MKRFIGIAIIALCLSILWFGTASAQQPTPSDDEVNAIASQLYCPVCENTPLDVCPTEACHDWRELIRQMLADGKTTSEIKQYFVDHYGARVLSEPPLEGFNWLIYIVPPAAFLLGIFLLIQAFKFMRRSEKTSPIQHPDASSAALDEKNLQVYTNRLEEELKKYK